MFPIVKNYKNIRTAFRNWRRDHPDHFHLKIERMLDNGHHLIEISQRRNDYEISLFSYHLESCSFQFWNSTLARGFNTARMEAESKMGELNESIQRADGATEGDCDQD